AAMAEELYDVTVIGAGPAGATAATMLGRKGYQVALVDRAAFPRPVTCGGWLSAKVEPLLTELGLSPKTLLECPFRDVTLYSADFSKSSKPRFDSSVGYLVDRSRFDNALASAAVQHGASLFQASAATDIRLNERSVAITLANRKRISSRLLLLAAGRGSELLERIGFPRQSGGNPLWTAQADARLPAGATNADPHVAVVLGLDGGGSFGLCCTSRDRALVNVNWAGARERAIPLLVDLCKAAFQHRVVPLDLSKQAASAELIRSPASAALDMDSHVAKHTLLIGDAGGFISAASNEGIYPAMWSAKLAVQAIDAALQSDVSQDDLMTFDSLWRTQMADHLRSPHTDIRFLLPLIFQNQPMADRMGAAFFFGDNL
ncbi:MAG: NAD(P)/FAD-dependent oxidoreductase, partial [Planctomycetes bacterium]|nr:NAD(P)/FAD-dependent oxidoreductase [Planctomycetota bacterium]